jgi:hypothetical protein
MVCDNIKCIIYYFEVSNHFTCMHLWNQGGKRTKNLCLVCYKEFKCALCNNRIRKLPVYKKENWSDFKSFWKQYIIVYTPRDKRREQYYLLKQERKKVFKLPSASCKTASPKSRTNCRMVCEGRIHAIKV